MSSVRIAGRAQQIIQLLPTGLHCGSISFKQTTPRVPYLRMRAFVVATGSRVLVVLFAHRERLYWLGSSKSEKIPKLDCHRTTAGTCP